MPFDTARMSDGKTKTQDVESGSCLGCVQSTPSVPFEAGAVGRALRAQKPINVRHILTDRPTESTNRLTD
jgi:hypothetical protein